jgi:hypothetical protein
MQLPKPTIERIEFKGEDKEYVDALLGGKPVPKTIKRWENSGMNLEYKKKWYIPPGQKERLLKLRQYYKIGTCHVCKEFASIKLIYKLPDVTLVEFFCEQHLPKTFD